MIKPAIEMAKYYKVEKALEQLFFEIERANDTVIYYDEKIDKLCKVLTELYGGCPCKRWGDGVVPLCNEEFCLKVKNEDMWKCWKRWVMKDD